MTLRDLLFELLDCGVDNLDAEVILFHEEAEVIDEYNTHKYVSIQDDFIDIAKNDDCVQIFLHNRPFREVN